MDLHTIANVPGVKSAVLCDPTGALLQQVRETDGEAVAAVMAFLAVTLAQVGEELGLGPLYRLSMAGPSRAALVVTMTDEILSAVVEPPAAFPAAEQAVDVILRG